MGYKATGEIHFVYPEQIITDKFKKREIIIITKDNPEYPQYVKFEFIQDKCALLDNFHQGQMVDIEFNLNGRMGKNKQDINVCWNQIQGWKISAAQG